MATSGTTDFNLDIIDIVEEAYEQAGLELRSGYELKTARRSLNLLALDWANRGYNLWTIQQAAIPLLTGVGTYALPADLIDVVEMVIRDSTSVPLDISVARIGMPVYATIPNKAATGRPNQVWVNRLIAPEIKVWPVPQNNNYTFLYWYMRRIQDSGASGENNFDIPVRFLPCLVTGLAYKIALKRPEAFDRLQVLKAEYEELWVNAASEDREKVPLRLVPARAYR